MLYLSLFEDESGELVFDGLLVHVAGARRGQPTGGSNSPPTSDLRRCALFNLGFLVGFDPRIDGKRLTFAEVGLLGGVFRMQDHQTGTIWTHLDGKAIAGPLVGHRLKMVPIPQATWAG